MLTHELITTKCAADKTGHFPDYYDWVVIFNADLYLALQKRFSPSMDKTEKSMLVLALKKNMIRSQRV